jgi:hypothetical protein
MEAVMTRWFFLFLMATGLQAQVLYEEQFSGGTTSLDWFSTWGEEADQVLVDWNADNPSGDGFVGKLGNGLSGGGVGTAIVDAPELDDYTVEAQIWLELNTSHYRGIVGRAHDIGIDTMASWEFYAFVADLSVATGMGDERFLLRRWEPGGSMTNIREWTSAELGSQYPAENGWYNLGMRFEGEEIHCMINGEELPGGGITDNTGLETIPSGGFGVYYFHFMDYDNFLFFDDVTISGDDTSIEAGQLPATLSLGQPWPNPFNPMVNLPLHLDAARHVRVDVLDLRGALVGTLIDAPLAAGEHQLSWDGRSSSGMPAASGMYLLNLRTLSGEAQTRTVTLLR